jgi:phosphomannomutase
MQSGAQRTVAMAELMSSSGVSFGTSGVRGTVDAMSDELCYAYAAAFLQYLAESGQLSAGNAVAIAGDRRPSTPRIMRALVAAASDLGFRTVSCGYIPTPALALFSIERRMPGMMVTGSHIPEDRNGIKFFTAYGEILKQDEAGIRARSIALPVDRFDDSGALLEHPADAPADAAAYEGYVERLTRFFGRGSLAGMHIGLYSHSGVSGDALRAILEQLDARVSELGRSDVFVPVDTEAIRPEDVKRARQWAAEGVFDAIVSFDGDGDRPLLSDEHGNWLRGDIVGVLCARALGIDCLATPVSSNSIAERCGWFQRITRTRIGSPYVIAAMQQLEREGCNSIAGYEANGGFLTQTPITLHEQVLAPLPTRDAALPTIALLVAARRQGLSLSALANTLPRRFTCSDRIKGIPTTVSQAHIQDLADSPERIDTLFGPELGALACQDQTDGLRLEFTSGDILHLRPSGNAPELRCYAEAGSPERAAELTRLGLRVAQAWASSPQR